MIYHLDRDKKLWRSVIDKWADRGSLVTTNGVFDIIHAGHIRMLKEASLQGKYLIIGLNSDNSIRRIKGENRPINNEEDRAQVLLALESVDEVICFNEDTPIELIKLIKPDILVKGGDWTIENIVGHEFVLENGGQVFSLPYWEGYSTSEIIEKMKK